MWLVSVYLIAPAAQHKELSYFSATTRQPGEVVRLPARGAEHVGLVVKCEPAADARQALRSADFSLKKIGGGKKILTPQFLHAAFEIARHEAVSAGAVVSALVPAAIFEKFDSLPEAAAHSAARHSAARHSARGTQYVILPREERLDAYRAIIKETLAGGRSALIVAPTIAEAERIASSLPHAILLHGSMNKKNLREAWHSIAASTKPCVVAGTTLALSAPRGDFGAIILERALARGYERAARPFVSARVCAEKAADALGAQFVLGSPMLPVRDASGRRAKRPASDARVSLVDMRPDKKIETEQLASRPKFELFSAEAAQRIEETIATGKNVVLLCARRGLAPHTACDDCGTAVSCPRCTSGLVLHEERRPLSLVEGGVKRWFACPYCGLVERANILCAVCGSWRLSMTGVGLTLVAREAEKKFGRAQHLVVDEAVLNAPATIKKLMAQFATAHGAVLSATEGALAYLEGTPALAVVVSADSMLFVPEYSAPERALSFFTELSGLAREVIVQTRAPEHPAVQAFVQNDYKPLYDRELELRKRFRYPPFATLIRLSVTGTPQKEKTQTDAVFAALESFRPQRYPGRPSRRGLTREHILLRLPGADWVDQKLLAFVRSLPPSIEIRVNPPNIVSD